MSATVYSPAGTLTAGNLRIGVVATPWTVNATTGKLSGTAAAANGGTVIQCAIETFGSTTNVAYRSRRKLCDKETTEKISTRTRNIDSLTITGDKTAETALLAILKEDAKIGLIARPYGPHTANFAPADTPLWMFNATVASVDPAPVSTADGEEFAYVVSFTDVKRDLAGTLTA